MLPRPHHWQVSSFIGSYRGRIISIYLVIIYNMRMSPKAAYRLSSANEICRSEFPLSNCCFKCGDYVMFYSGLSLPHFISKEIERSFNAVSVA